jgi:hypothetical protein
VAREIKYRTFDELLSEVSIDFSTYFNEGMIEPAQLIKVVLKINKELGIRINKTREVILELNHGKVRLPENLYLINRAFICDKYQVVNRKISGTHKEDVILDPDECTKCGQPDITCSCEKTYSVCTDTHVKVIERKSYETREYEHFHRIYIKPHSTVSPVFGCKPHEAQIAGEVRDGFLFVQGCNHGKVYLSYESTMEDENGELLVIDHPIINKYYEDALKNTILMNLYFNGEDTERKWKFMEEEMRKSKIQAFSIVNTPDFKELYENWSTNRKIQRYKYYNMFI